MHLKALLTTGAATASLLAGTAGTALLGHAASVPAAVQPAPHHVSAPNHPGGTRGKSGTVTHKHKNTTGNSKGNVRGHAKGHAKAKPKPKPTPTPGV